MATPSLALPFATEFAPVVTTARATGTRLTVRGLTKHYEGLAALDAVDLDVGAGELVALLGPSGSGKTTLLRVIAGLLAPDAGRVQFDDSDATQLSLRERGVGFVFQHYALFRHMTVAENIAFGLRSRPRSRRPAKAEITRRVQELLALVQLPEHGGRYPEQLSGGQKQRIALARALAIEPRVLLLDEPFGALDAKVRIELRRWLRRLHEQTGQTTLFVTHDQEEALELADRVVLLRDGRIEQIGTPAEIYESPASAFAFDFIGRASSIDGEVRDGRFVGEDGFAVATDSVSGPSRLYMRPHDIALADTGLAGRVVDVRRLAGTTTLEIEVARGGLVEVDVDRTAATPSRGDAVHLQPRRYRVFPRA
ncbi:sulfate/molybdate ABC transporter ATP-binding protein [Lysobacter sp. HA18]